MGIAARRASKVDALIGERIRDVRLRLEMSQTALGERIGVSFQQVQKYENGANRIGAARLLAIADALSVHYSVLFEGAKDVPRRR